jgi:endonuclease V-like protein UPF0215 family
MVGVTTTFTDNFFTEKQVSVVLGMGMRPIAKVDSVASLLVTIDGALLAVSAIECVITTGFVSETISMAVAIGAGQVATCARM